MKILYIHRSQGRGAEGVHITSVVLALRALGHEVELLSPPGIDPFATAGESPVDKARTRTSGIRTVWSFVSRNLPQWLFETAEILYNAYLLPRLLLRLRKGGYDFVYERYAFFHFAPAVACRLMGIPRGMEMNEVCGIKRARGQRFLGLLRRIEAFTTRSATALFPVSSFLKKRLVERGVPPGRIRVVPNAVTDEVFGRRGSGEEVRRALGIEGKVVAGFAGWFDDWDRLDLLVRIFRDVRSLAPAHLLLIGSGSMMEALRQLVSSLGLEDDVTLTGPVPRAEVLKYIDALDVPVVTHSNEFGSPMVLFEFLALGKCVVAPRLDPMLDVLEDGTNALLFDPGDWEGVRRLLGEALTDPALRRRLGDAAREKGQRHHTWKATARVILDAMVRPGEAGP